MRLEFNTYAESIKALNAVADSPDVKIVRRAAGCEEVVFANGDAITFRARTRAKKECCKCHA